MEKVPERKIKFLESENLENLESCSLCIFCYHFRSHLIICFSFYLYNLSLANEDLALEDCHKCEIQPDMIFCFDEKLNDTV